MIELDIEQYQVVIVNLDPTVGSEIKKTRPCVVLSPDEMNRQLRTVIIAPLTSTSKNYPTRVPVRLRKQKSWAVLDQIRTIDRRRIIKSAESLKDGEVEQIKSVIREMLVD